jgi:hypothetical protein
MAQDEKEKKARMKQLFLKGQLKWIELNWNHQTKRKRRKRKQSSFSFFLAVVPRCICRKKQK